VLALCTGGITGPRRLGCIQEPRHPHLESPAGCRSPRSHRASVQASTSNGRGSSLRVVQCDIGPVVRRRRGNGGLERQHLDTKAQTKTKGWN